MVIRHCSVHTYYGAFGVLKRGWKPDSTSRTLLTLMQPPALPSFFLSSANNIFCVPKILHAHFAGAYPKKCCCKSFLFQNKFLLHYWQFNTLRGCLLVSFHLLKNFYACGTALGQILQMNHFYELICPLTRPCSCLWICQTMTNAIFNI